MQTSKPLRVVHAVASLAEASGGPPRSVISLSEQLGALGCKVDIVTLDNRQYFGPEVPHDPKLVTVHRVPSYYFKPLRLIHAPAFGLELQRVAADADLIHVHGIWLPVNHTAARVARRLGLPYVISVRGNFHTAALSSAAWKKKLARKFFVDADVQGASCLHATSTDEESMIRQQGFTNPIAVLPAGISTPSYSADELRRVYARTWPELVGKRVLLFLGRIHPHKGVEYLAETWAKIARHHPDWHLVMAGVDENDTRKSVASLLDTAGTVKTCTFTGPVTGPKKWALIANCGLLVLPSRSENFGHSVGEALAMGRPALTTDTTPWDDLEKFDCGWRIPVGAEALTQKLPHVLDMSRAELEKKGSNGAQLIKSRYEAERVAKAMLSVYRCMSTKIQNWPECVRAPSIGE